MQSEQMTVPFDRLVRDDAANVRKKYGDEAIEEMKASILAHGIIQPIAVRPPQTGDADLGGQLYRIFAGGRRWVAMGELVKEGKIPADYSVPIIIREVGDAEATELSLAENLVREQMTPADEFRAFAKLASSGQSVADIALHFGQTERYVKGRMALANLHPEILAAFEAGKLRYAAACAYTTNPDIDAQIAYYRTASWMKEDPHYIKNALRSKDIERADGSFAKLIGEEAYVAAGGVVHADLFGDDVHWTSTELFADLLDAKIESLRTESTAAGWSFFATMADLGVYNYWSLNRIEPEGDGLSKEDKKRLTEVEKELAALRQAPQADEAEEEDEYYPDDDGDFDPIDEEEDEPDTEMQERQERMDALRGELQALHARAKVFTAEQKAASGVVLDTSGYRIYLGVMRPTEEEIARRKQEAAEREARISGSTSEPLATAAKAQKDPLALTQPLKDKIGETASDALSAGVIADPHKALALVTAMLATADVFGSGIGRPSRIKVERMGHGGSADTKLSIEKLFGTFAALAPDELLKRFAGFAAQTVDLTEAWFQKDYTQDPVREKTRKTFLEAFSANPLETFDADAWFTACTKPMIDAAMKEMTGFGATKPKKADMAREAAEKARETGWLPKPLRLAGYALKGKKPAGAKKSAAKKAAGKSKAKAG